jgi:hypothetical protein
MSDMQEPTRPASRQWRQSIVWVVIPVCGLLIGGVLFWIALRIAPADNAPGFQRETEIMRACLTLAVAFISGGVVTFILSQYGRTMDDRRKDAEERRRLVAELREVHHDVKTAQLRIRAHRTVRTYGEQIREAVFPAVAQLGGAISDVKRQLRKPAETVALVGEVSKYLEDLTNEYEESYLRASLLQEAEYKWRQQRVAELVKQDRFATTPPTYADVVDESGAEGPAWDYLIGKEEGGQYRFPRLIAFLEIGDKAETKKHQVSFSEPIRNAMDFIDSSR